MGEVLEYHSLSEPQSISDESQVLSVPVSEMDECRIPKFLQNSYLSGTPPPAFSTLRPWQRSLLLTKEWQLQKNAIVLAPTAGGKTLIAEVAFAQALECNTSAKILYCVPFVALATEKHNLFTLRFPSVTVKSFYHDIGIGPLTQRSISVCTYEKAHSLINSSASGKFDIDLIVIDEFHMLDDTDRGANLESLIVLSMLLPNHPRIIGLTATMTQDDAIKLSIWLGGFSFKAEINESPSRQQYYICRPNGELCPVRKGYICPAFRTLKKDDKFYISSIIAPFMKMNSKNVLIFAQTRKECEEISFLLAKLLGNINKEDENIQIERKNLLEKLDESFSCVLNGIAFHHAGLTQEERILIENAFRNGIIKIIVATSTLSAGVDFQNISVVVILSAFKSSMQITPSKFMQMCGRAGRNERSSGTVVVIERFNSDETQILRLMRNEIPPIKLKLIENQNELAKTILHLHAFFTNQSIGNLKSVLYSYIIEGNDISKEIQTAIDSLKSYGMCISPKVSKFGRAVALSNLNINNAVHLNSILRKNMRNFMMSDEAFAMYLCCYPNLSFLKIPKYNETIWSVIMKRHSEAANAILNSASDIIKIRASDCDKGLPKLNDQNDEILGKIFASAILVSFSEENSVATISKTFKVDKGAVENLRDSSVVYASQVVKFCESAGFREIAAILTIARNRIQHGAKNDVIPLMSLGCSQSTARALFSAGITSKYEIEKCSIEKLVSIISASQINSMISAVDSAKKLKQAAIRAITAEETLSQLEERSLHV